MQHINKYISTVMIITDVLSLALYVEKNECYIVAARQAYKNFGTISISTKTMHCKHNYSVVFPCKLAMLLSTQKNNMSVIQQSFFGL